MMSKKHYIAIAAAIKAERERCVQQRVSNEALIACSHIAKGIADYCARDNAAFNRSRFLEACGVTS